MTTKTIELSGLYYPNKLARVFIAGLNDVLGTSGLNSIFNHIGLPQLINNWPPENLERQFDFAHFTALCVGLEDIFGERGGRGLALRAGRACFTHGLKGFGALAGAGDLAFKVLPLPTKLKLGFPALAKVFSNFSDQETDIEEYDDHYLYIIKKCPCCWNRKSTKPCCHVATGVLQEGLRWVSGGLEFRVVQTQCHATNDEFCKFVCYKTPINTSA